eukprot:1458075-Pleurochrysis_carterae.AAC.1
MRAPHRACVWRDDGRRLQPVGEDDVWVHGANVQVVDDRLLRRTRTHAHARMHPLPCRDAHARTRAQADARTQAQPQTRTQSTTANTRASTTASTHASTTASTHPPPPPTDAPQYSCTRACERN